MPNCDFYAAGPDHRLVLDFLLTNGDCDIYELGSRFERPLQAARGVIEPARAIAREPERAMAFDETAELVSQLGARVRRESIERRGIGEGRTGDAEATGKAEQVSRLGELLDDQGPVVFKSTGMSWEDAVVAACILERAE